MPTRPGEKVILIFNEKPHKRYGIVHLNKHDPKVLHILEGIVSGNTFIAEYRVGKDCPMGHLGRRYVIGKRYDTKNGISDVFVHPEEDLIYEELYELALKEAQEYAKSRGLNFEDQTSLKPKHL